MTMQRLIELAGGLDRPHIICGDLNAWPGTAPYQLVADGHLNDTSFTDLQAILTIDSGDSQVTVWTVLFLFSLKYAYCATMLHYCFQLLFKQPSFQMLFQAARPPEVF